MRHYLQLSGLFFLFLMFGGAWTWLVRLLPEGLPRDLVVLALGVAFVVVYLVLLVRRIRVVLRGPEQLWPHVGLLLVELGVLLLAFALMHQEIGIVDTTRPGNPVTHDLWSSLYFSIITFTTVGFGDFYPVGAGRALAALQGLTGYLILGSLASTVASMLSPYSKAGPGGVE